jgi:hypothetical protein
MNKNHEKDHAKSQTEKRKRQREKYVFNKGQEMKKKRGNPTFHYQSITR